MPPRVSIVIPSYNHGRFLRECLDRVLAQTFEDWELILVDDGSKDDSVAIARTYKDPRVHVHVNDKNLGTYGTQQAGLNLATGEFVAILNSDDLWEPRKLLLQVDLLGKHPEASFSYCLGWKVDDAGKVDTTDDVHANWPTEPIQDVLPYLLFENRILASSVLFRREQLRFETSCRYSGDWVALLEQAYLGPAACVTERVSYWRMHDNNTFTASPKQRAEEVRVRRSIGAVGNKWAVRGQSHAAIHRGLGLNELNLCALSLSFGDRAGAIKAGIKAFQLGPFKRTALKRALSALLPLSVARKRFAAGGFPEVAATGSDELKSLLQGIQPMTFKL